MTDYLAQLDCEVKTDADGIRVVCAGRSVLYKALSAAVVRRAMHDAMEVVVSYFAANAAKSGQEYWNK